MGRAFYVAKTAARRDEASQPCPYLTEYVKRFGDCAVDPNAVPAPLDGPMPDSMH